MNFERTAGCVARFGRTRGRSPAVAVRRAHASAAAILAGRTPASRPPSCLVLSSLSALSVLSVLSSLTWERSLVLVPARQNFFGATTLWSKSLGANFLRPKNPR